MTGRERRRADCYARRITRQLHPELCAAGAAAVAAATALITAVGAAAWALAVAAACAAGMVWSAHTVRCDRDAARRAGLALRDEPTALQARALTQVAVRTRTPGRYSTGYHQRVPGRARHPLGMGQATALDVIFAPGAVHDDLEGAAARVQAVLDDELVAQCYWRGRHLGVEAAVDRAVTVRATVGDGPARDVFAQLLDDSDVDPDTAAAAALTLCATATGGVAVTVDP